MEIARGKMYHYVCWVTPDGLGVIEANYFHPEIRRDIQDLRRALFHKHTDPKKERLYQLIDKIRNA